VADPALTAWLRLTLVPGVGPETQRHLLAAFGLPEQVFSAPRSALKQVVGKKADLLLDTDNQEAVDRALDWAGKPGNRILTLADPDYPQLLLESADPPSLLYVKGRVELLNRPALAIVGSRNATPQGLKDAEALAADLAAQGLTIVSGLALGIDGAAHRGGLKGEGGSVAIIGTGADRIYPSRHKELALQLATEGAIVSEMPPGTQPQASHFPRRNRIISGLSQGVVVLEASLKSGSLITARMAAEQGREVFAIPGSIHAPQSRGCHALIRQGAKLVESAQDVLEELKIPATTVPGLPQEGVSAPGAAASDETEDPVLAALGYDPMGLDALIARTGMDASTLQVALLELELEGRIARLPGGLFQRVGRG